MKTLRRSLPALLLGLAAGALIIGCTVDSANSTFRTVSVNVAGVYRYDGNNCANDGRFVTANSGRSVISLDVRQTGDSLEAIDNNGIVFRGTIGNVSDSTASYNLEGSTTAGNGVVISGSIEVGGGQGVMRATWIEDTFFATLCGSANGPSATTNAPIVTNATNGSITISAGLLERDYAEYRTLAWWLDRG